MAKEITYADISKVNAEMKMTDIGRGKEYAEVPSRVEAFRKIHPNGSITSEIISMENGVVVIKATVADENGCILGTGHAYEKEGNGFINKTSYIENCETSAWGRALAACGIIGGGSIASFEEVGNAMKQQQAMSEEELKAEVKKLLQETDSDVVLFLEWCGKTCKRPIESVDVMHEVELKEALKMLKAKQKKKEKESK